MKTRNIYLIDGSSYIYRAFYAMRNLSTSKGMPTNAIYILSRMLIKLIKEESPQKICFVLDSKGPTHRHDMYEDYKATRQKMPEDLQAQFPYIIRIIEALGIPIVRRESLEADDIIATLARRYGGTSEKVVIISGDKDLMQLVNENTTVWDTLKDKVYGPDEVKEKYGVYPEYIADLLAIMGDSSDNIPGVAGIGAKGAVALIDSMGHLDNILSNIESVSQKRYKKALQENIDSARTGYELVRLDRDADLGTEIIEIDMEQGDQDLLNSIFKELEFRAMIEETGQDKANKTPDVFEGKIEYSPLPDLPGGVLAGMYILENTASALIMDDTVYICRDRGAYLDILNRPGLNLCMHDAKRALVEAKRSGIHKGCRCFDTMLAAYCIDAASGTVSLEDLSRAYLGRDIRGTKDMLGSGRNARKMADLDDKEIEYHLATHVNALVPLKERLQKEITDVGVERIYSEIEIPLLDVLAGMEARGVFVDKGLLSEISKEISFHIEGMEEKIYSLSGRPFNINSPKQLGEILFEEMGLPIVKKTKTGYSTDSKVLGSLAARHELPGLILDYRSLAKLKNTYVDSLPGMIDPVTGRVHTRFNQATTATGRISSSEPNLQNIPIRTDMGKRIREAFTAPEGFKILSADYSQIELRILAHITRDKTLIESFANEMDIHARTAAEVFDIPLEEVSENQRRQAKTINFGIIYGMGPHKLSGELRIKRDVAKRYIESYLAKYPGVGNYMQTVSENASKDGFVTTILGRRRTIPGINSQNFNEREGAKRIAINTPIQGSAADIIKIAMVRIHERLKTMRSSMIIQVHDELVFEVADSEVEELSTMVSHEMENAYPLNVPLKVDIGIGDNWARAH